VTRLFTLFVRQSSSDSGTISTFSGCNETSIAQYHIFSSLLFRKGY